MRVDVIDRFLPFSSNVSCYTFRLGVSDHIDILFLGLENGKICSISIPCGQLPHNIRPVDATKDGCNQHTAEVRCLLFTNNNDFLPPQSNGLLFSGSFDRSIKIWNVSAAGNQIVHIQTLQGHCSTVNNVIDGTDGSIISCSEDGSLRMWCPQHGRNMMQYPYFECTFSLFGREAWITALAVGILGPWICYAADSSGCIEVLKKSTDGATDAERHLNAFSKQLTRCAKWEKVHALGITHLELVREENVLVSISYDTSCKVLDPSTGQVLYQIMNKRRCVFTGATWVNHLTSFYLIDEFGYLDILNLYHERVIESVKLTGLTSKQAINVLKCHGNQALSSISRYNQDGYFLTIVASQEGKSTAIASVNGATVPGGSTAIRLKTVGVNGEVVLWNLSNDVNCMEFVGHVGNVVGISVPSFTAASASRTHTVRSEGSLSCSAVTNASFNNYQDMCASTLQISSDEKLFFSAGHEDSTIRCWDEYDQAETYQFNSKGVSEITVMLAIWHMNRVVTGHENGAVCIWNADTGARVISYALKHTVSSLAEAASTHSKLLLGADYSGKVVMWNLTLHYLNPTQLIQVPGDMDGFHNHDDPGILSLCFHDGTKTIFSGGNDATVRFWRLHSDAAGGCFHSHNESVSLLKCTSSFLLSGDEEGNLHLCRLQISAEDESVLSRSERRHVRPSFAPNNEQELFSNPEILQTPSKILRSTNPANLFISGLTLLCAWNTYPVSMRALGDICELDLTTRGGSAYGGGKRVLVTHVGPTGSGRTRVWEIWIQKRSIIAGQCRTHRAGGGLEVLRQSAALLNYELAVSVSQNSQVPSEIFIPPSECLDVGFEKASSPVGLSNTGKYRINNEQNPDLYISVSELHCLNHDKYEISCCTMAMSEHIAAPTATSSKLGVIRAALAATAVTKTDALEAFRQATLVYLGTSAGLIFRFSFRKL
eukprot:CAMPEP_0170372228 /NCGR_PEP_ID=MMETSP0117_2-20130122/9443_1 /TAXON_ID=400756 /ORGANISM="Durinskia baltica, Strain CSIRO CS-38" /LENGTH=940 /DNA_ID=CAMNT_0010627077 /DNA_START=24 /DNA_END=2846 /DNA_ORIENTATION=+